MYMLWNNALHLALLTTFTKGEKIYWNTCLTSPDFEQDRQYVWAIILLLILDTQAWPCFKKYNKEKNILPDWSNFRTFYEGDDMHTTQMAQVREVLLHLFYKDEHTFTFTSYVSELLCHFYTLEMGKQGNSETEKVTHLSTIFKIWI